MKKFPHPLNKWIDEEVDITVVKPTIDPKTGAMKLKPTIEKKRQKVFYTKGIVKKLSCKDNNHYFVVKDKKTGVFACKHCTLHRKLYPVTHDVVNGKIIDRE